jgi:hypothetical protein
MRIKVLGAGSAFKDLMALKSNQVEVVACFSNTLTVNMIMNVQVFDNLTKFILIPASYIVLALRDVASAKRQLINAGVPNDQIISFYNSGDTVYLNMFKMTLKV